MRNCIGCRQVAAAILLCAALRADASSLIDRLEAGEHESGGSRAPPLDTEALISDSVEGMGRSGQGSGSGGGFFGDAGHPGIGLLEGTLYDLKQRSDGRPSDLGDGTDSAANNTRYFKIIQRLLAAGMRDSAMRNYYRHPKKLYLGQMSIPGMPATEAPRAFEADVKALYLAIVYRGLVSPPKDGTYIGSRGRRMTS